MAKKKTESTNLTYKVEGTKIIVGKERVDIFLPNKKVSYMADKSPNEYANYAMIFTEGQTDDDVKKYAKTLVGLEMIPSFAHSDSNLAFKILDVVLSDFTEKLNDIKPRSEDEEELIKDAQSILELKLKEMVDEKEK